MSYVLHLGDGGSRLAAIERLDARGGPDAPSPSRPILLGLGVSTGGLAAWVIPAAVSHRLPPAVFANYSPKYLSATWMPSSYIF